MPEDGSAVAEGGTAVTEAGTIMTNMVSAVSDCFSEYPFGIKIFLKFENKPIGWIAHIPEI